MSDQFTRQAQEMFAAAQDARIPENIQAFVEDSVAKSRDAFEKISSVTQDNAKSVEGLVSAAQDGVKSLGEKMLENTAVNAEAAFDAAEEISRAKTLPEAARIQASFVQSQMSVAGAQTKELFELYTKVAQQSFETLNAVANNSFEKLKK